MKQNMQFHFNCKQCPMLNVEIQENAHYQISRVSKKVHAIVIRSLHKFFTSLRIWVYQSSIYANLFTELAAVFVYANDLPGAAV